MADSDGRELDLDALSAAFDRDRPSLAEAAVVYASAGFPVLPVHKDKRPACPRGVHNANPDPAVARQRWAAEHGANVGLATGDRFIVIDIDPRNGGDVSFAELEGELGELPRTAVAETGGGGDHIYLRCPPGVVVRGRNNLRPGVDVKAVGGYAVAPPSIHQNGNRYRWRCLETFQDVPPAWLEAINSKKRKGDAKATGSSRESDVGSRIGEGGRNEALTRFAGRLRHLGMDEEEIYAALTTFNDTRCDPPLDDEEVRRVTTSIARYPAGKTGESRRSVALVPANQVVVPDVSYLLDGLVPARGLTLLHGPTFAAKSRLAAAIAMSVTSGASLLGASPSRTRRVAWLHAEHQVHEAPQRLRAAALGLHLDPEMTERVDLVNPRTLRMDLHQDVDALRTLTEEHILVVIDSLGAATDANENDATISRAVNYLGVALGEHRAVLLIAHDGKAGKLRGHTGIRGAADHVLHVVPRRDNLTVTITGRDASDRSVMISVDHQEDAMTISAVGDAKSSERHGSKLTEDELDGLILECCGNGPVGKDRIYNSVRSRGNVTRSGVRSRVEHLTRTGRLHSTAQGARTVPSFGAS